jgi:hypothetical protein
MNALTVSPKVLGNVMLQIRRPGARPVAFANDAQVLLSRATDAIARTAKADDCEIVWNVKTFRVEISSGPHKGAVVDVDASRS